MLKKRDNFFQLRQVTIQTIKYTPHESAHIHSPSAKVFVHTFVSLVYIHTYVYKH